MRKDTTKGMFKPELISSNSKRYRNVKSSRDTLYSSRDVDRKKEVKKDKSRSTSKDSKRSLKVNDSSYKI
jgi:hypothetical protein